MVAGGDRGVDFGQRLTEQILGKKRCTDRSQTGGVWSMCLPELKKAPSPAAKNAK